MDNEKDKKTCSGCPHFGLVPFGYMQGYCNKYKKVIWATPEDGSYLVPEYCTEHDVKDGEV